MSKKVSTDPSRKASHDNMEEVRHKIQIDDTSSLMNDDIGVYEQPSIDSIIEKVRLKKAKAIAE